MARAPLLVGDATPFDAGREGRSASSGETGGSHLGDDPIASKGHRGLQCPVAAAGPVILEAGGIHHADACQQAKARVARLGNRHRRGRDARVDDHGHLGHPHGPTISGGDRQVRPTPALDHHRRSPLALAQAWAGLHVVAPGPQVVDQVHGPDEATGDVVTHMDRVVGSRRLMGEQVVEGRHAVGLGRRYLQDPAGVVEPSGTDPTSGTLECVECGQQEVSPLTHAGTTTVDQPLRHPDGDRTPVGYGLVHRGLLGISGLVDSAEVEVRHLPPPSRQVPPGRRGPVGRCGSPPP